MERLDDVRVLVHPGAGIVAHLGSAVLVCLPVTEAQHQVADALLASLEQEAIRSMTPGRGIAQRVGELLGRTPPADVPPLAVISPADGGGLAVLLHGAIETHIQQAVGHHVISGRDALTWVDRVIQGSIDRLDIRAPEPPAAGPDLRSRLERGVVPGAGVTVVPRTEAPATAQSVAAPPPAASQSPAPPAAPGTGVLVGDDGARIDLVDDYVLGRDPFDHPDVIGGRARPFLFLDSESEISRAHARVTVRGAQVTITDLASANGTYIAAPGATEWQRLPPDQPTPIGVGHRVLVGQRTFVFRDA